MFGKYDVGRSEQPWTECMSRRIGAGILDLRLLARWIQKPIDFSEYSEPHFALAWQLPMARGGWGPARHPRAPVTNRTNAFRYSYAIVALLRTRNGSVELNCRFKWQETTQVFSLQKDHHCEQKDCTGWQKWTFEQEHELLSNQTFWRRV